LNNNIEYLNNMKLSDQKYNELMKLESISVIAEKLKWHMLNRSDEAYREEKEKTDQSRKEHINAIEILKNIIENDTLVDYLNLKKKELIRWLDYFQEYKKRYLDGKRKRIKKHLKINQYLVVLTLRLIKNGVHQPSRREDFIFRFISENNLEGYKFSDKSKEDEGYQINYTYKMNEQSIRRMIRKVDKKFRDAFD